MRLGLHLTDARGFLKLPPVKEVSQDAPGCSELLTTGVAVGSECSATAIQYSNRATELTQAIQVRALMLRCTRWLLWAVSDHGLRLYGRPRRCRTWRAA